MLLRVAATGLMALLACAIDGSQARAQADYPSHPVKVIASSAPGGNADFIARLIAGQLSERLKQPFVVDNRPGAASTIGATAIARAAPDGYTIGIIAVNTHAIAPNMSNKAPFDHIRDFTPISQLTAYPNILVVNPAKVRARSVPEFIAELKANAGKYSFGSSGNGGSLHLSGELFMSMTGTKMVHVPYKGSGPMLADLLGGHVDLSFDNLPSSLPHVRAGKLVALAVTSAQRSPELPDVPALSEFLPGYEATSWHGLAGPAGLPAPVLEKLGAAAVAAMREPAVIELLRRSGGLAVGSSDAEFRAHIARETQKWGKVIEANGLRAN